MTTQVRLTRKNLAKAIRNFLDHHHIETVMTPGNLITEGDFILIQGEVAVFHGTNPDDPKTWLVDFPLSSEKQALLKGPWVTFDRFVTPDQPNVSAVVLDLANMLEPERRAHFIEKWINASRIPSDPPHVYLPVTHILRGDVFRLKPSSTLPGHEVVRIEDRDGQAAILSIDLAGASSQDPAWHLTEWGTRYWVTRKHRSID